MQCPQCKNDVPTTEAQYGALYTCPKCLAVYFLDFNGQPEFGNMDIPLVETAEDNPVQNFESFSEPVEPEVLEAVHSAETDLSLNNDFNQDFNLSSLIDSEPVEIKVEQVELKTRAMSSSFAAAAQEITDYGNQEEVISSISYDVMIKGLDTKELMQSFKEAIEDSKFAWLAQDILGQIKNGEVDLKNLNPIQAFVLAQRIHFLDLEIEWKQNVAF